MELNAKPQIIMGIMEHAAAWVSHVPLSLLDYNTQTGGPAGAKGKKKKK